MESQCLMFWVPGHSGLPTTTHCPHLRHSAYNTEDWDQKGFWVSGYSHETNCPGTSWRQTALCAGWLQRHTFYHSVKSPRFYRMTSDCVSAFPVSVLPSHLALSQQLKCRNKWSALGKKQSKGFWCLTFENLYLLDISDRTYNAIKSSKVLQLSQHVCPCDSNQLQPLLAPHTAAKNL